MSEKSNLESLPAARTFSIWINDRKMNFDKAKLARLSKIVAQLIKKGQTQYTISKKVCHSARIAFANACRLSSFKVTLLNAFDLQYLAVEMGVTSLEMFVNKYIKAKNLTPQEKNDNDYLDYEEEEEKKEEISPKSGQIQQDQELNQKQKKQDETMKNQYNENKMLTKEIANLTSQVQALTKENEELKQKQKDENKKHEKEISDLTSQIQELKQKIKGPQFKTSQELKSFEEFKILEKNVVENLNKLDLLGTGMSGRVYKVGKEEIYVAKYLNTDNGFDFEKFKYFMNEYEILTMLNHPNIIKVYGFYNGDDETSPMILMEYCSNSLHDEIVNKRLNDYEKAIIVYQIVEGFKYVHFKNIIHRDVKAQNILINDNKTVKICDFGFSKLMIPNEVSMSVCVGTFKYMAPELFKSDTHYTSKVDIYSFGILLYFIICGELPKISIDDVCKGILPKIPSYVNDFARKLLENCWSYDPELRPSFDTIYNLLKEKNYEIVDLNSTEKKQVLCFVEKHISTIPLYDQTSTTKITEISGPKISRPQVTHPKPKK
ncbi:hypothetical protein M9Y10_000300 [Tritrichomonas musculus]|uniref:Protein kinase domain-containing protein n=1 Tax=Tritrichomonas musculus TaxID=1915356 RepID=A0ABR2L6Z7_9EUKA